MLVLHEVTVIERHPRRVMRGRASLREWRGYILSLSGVVPLRSAVIDYNPVPTAR